MHVLVYDRGYVPSDVGFPADPGWPCSLINIPSTKRSMSVPVSAELH